MQATRYAPAHEYKTMRSGYIDLVCEKVEKEQDSVSQKRRRGEQHSLAKWVGISPKLATCVLRASKIAENCALYPLWPRDDARFTLPTSETCMRKFELM